MAEMTSYRITVVTGPARGAGTDADVSITLVGDKATSPELPLDGGGNDFERGATNVFRVSVKDIGILQKIRIRHNNTGVGAGWMLDHVRIVDEASGAESVFPCGRWLADDEDDNQITRDLLPA